MTHSASTKPTSIPASESLRETLVPASYDALTEETYNLLLPITDRDTLIPPPSSQMTLELACAGVEVEW